LIICVVSRTKKRGKTALIERLIQRLADQEFKAATVKHISSSFDTPKRDTWRHLEAGAVMTVASTPNELITLTRTRAPSLEEALDAIGIEPDIILVEGYKTSSYPKILCANTAEEAQDALKEISNIIMVSGLISGNAKEKKQLESRSPNIPVYEFMEVARVLKEMLIKKDLRKPR
jgi:molybdopterin-guanine dinucleotide biosynthesis protein B